MSTIIIDNSGYMCEYSYMAGKAKKAMVNVFLEPGMLKRIDDYRFSNRIQSRSEAMRQLLEKGLGTPKKVKK